MQIFERVFTIDRAKAKPIVLMPLGDIQWTGDSGDCATETLKERIDYGLSLGAYFIGMGDYIDYASPSNRRALEKADIYDTARKVHDRTARWLVRDLFDKFLKKTKNRWLWLLEGHHFSQLDTGITSDQYLCEMLNAMHGGTQCLGGLHISFGKQIVGTTTVWSHHGQGGGQKQAAPLNKLEAQVIPDWEADIYLIGHMTKQANAPLNRVYPSWNYCNPKKAPAKLRHFGKQCVGTGGFGKGYIERHMQGRTPRGTYVEQGMMRPAVLGCPVVKVHPRIIDKLDPMDGKRHNYYKPLIDVETRVGQ